MWHNNCKGLLLATLLTWSTLLMCTTVGATTEGQETPLALPVAELTQPTTAIQGEVWEEDDHEVLIRNERGTKSDGMALETYQLPYNDFYSLVYRSLLSLWQESLDRMRYQDQYAFPYLDTEEGRSCLRSDTHHTEEMQKRCVETSEKQKWENENISKLVNFI